MACGLPWLTSALACTPHRRIAGVEGKHVAFLFGDNHIVSEAFVEDINNLLNRCATRK
jgi:hypothetical protein